MGPYEQGHLVVAALRVYVYQNQRPPTVNELGEMLRLSKERIYYLCNRLEHLGVLELIQAAFGERIYLRDHLKLELLPREDKAADLEAEVKKLKEDRQTHLDALQKQRADAEASKKDLFSDLDRQLKEGLKQKKNPSDDT